MKFFCLVLLLVLLKIATALHCKCTGWNCDIRVLDTCYTIHSCFTQTVGGKTTYGCIRNDDYEKLFCDRTLKCCKTDLCNNKGLPLKPYLKAPSIKLASLEKRTVTVYIRDSFQARGNIDGYVAISRTPGKSERKFKLLASNTRMFTFDDLYVNTTYVIEVASYRDNLTSEISAPITFKTETPVCVYYKKGETGSMKTESCKSFGCFGTWSKNGTKMELQERGCWNDVKKPRCLSVPVNSVPKHVVCTCNTRMCSLLDKPKNTVFLK